MRVFVYYNLHKHVWSVRAEEGEYKGRVIAHRDSLLLRDAQFKVSEAGRQRVLASRRKNVHAGVVGELLDFETDYDTRITYNPYKYGHFYVKDTEEAVYHADVVAFNGRAVTVSGFVSYTK